MSGRSTNSDKPGSRPTPDPSSGAVVFQDDPGVVFPGEREVELHAAIEAVLAGGRATLPFYRSADLHACEKRPGDFVTEADHAANEAVLAALARRFGADATLSEESPRAASVTGSARLWIIDPLDGTREFMDGIDEFAVMVGLAEGGRASLGAVYVPGSQRLYVGLSSGGAWAADCLVMPQPQAPVRVATFKPLRVGRPATGRTRLVRSRSHPDPLLRSIEEALPAVEAIPSGSVGVKCARIAEREADLYVHPVPHLKEWDTCAPEAILRGAGGRVTDCAGSDLRYGKPHPPQSGGILAGDPDSWAAALPLVRRLAAPIL